MRAGSGDAARAFTRRFVCLPDGSCVTVDDSALPATLRGVDARTVAVHAEPLLLPDEPSPKRTNRPHAQRRRRRPHQPEHDLINPRTSCVRPIRPRQPETLPNVEGLGTTRTYSANRHLPRTTLSTRTRPNQPDNDLPNTTSHARTRPRLPENDLAIPRTTSPSRRRPPAPEYDLHTATAGPNHHTDKHKEPVYYASSPSTTPLNGLLNASKAFSKPLRGVPNAEMAQFAHALRRLAGAGRTQHRNGVAERTPPASAQPAACRAAACPTHAYRLAGLYTAARRAIRAQRWQRRSRAPAGSPAPARCTGRCRRCRSPRRHGTSVRP